MEGPEATDATFDELLRWLNAYLPCFGVVSSPRKEGTAVSWRPANIAAGEENNIFFARTGLIVTLRVVRTVAGGPLVSLVSAGGKSVEKKSARASYSQENVALYSFGRVLHFLDRPPSRGFC